MAGEDEPRGITVRGVGRVVVPPDQATLSLGVEGRAKTAVQAQAAASTAMTGLIAALDDLGIAPRDRATTLITLEATYTYPADGKPARLSGYQARQTLEVLVRDLSQLGGVLDGTIAAGATQAGSVTLGLNDPSAAADRARALAVADALRRAQVLARAAGVGVGPAMHIAEVPTGPVPGPRPMAMARMAAEAAPTPVEAGSTTVSVELEVTFAIA
jgi:uncharacterized protein